jgi:hypothetical protein
VMVIFYTSIYEILIKRNVLLCDWFGEYETSWDSMKCDYIYTELSMRNLIYIQTVKHE